MPTRDDDMLRRAAQTMLGEPVVAIEPVARGANSALYKLHTARGVIALKRYPPAQNDLRQRLTTEWTALRFLRAQGLDQVPEPLALDNDAGLLALEWLPGTPADPPREADLGLLLDFIGRVFACSDRPGADQFGADIEACLAPSHILDQIAARLQRLAGSTDVEQVIAEDVTPHLQRAEAAVDQPAPLGEVPRAQQRLVVADIGFHNALRRPDGRLAFIDFDCFGWDDPVKTAADFLLHPTTRLTPEQQSEAVRRLAAFAPVPAAHLHRLRRLLPLYAIRWALILLNPFRAGDLNSPPSAAARSALLADRRAKIKATLDKSGTLIRIAEHESLHSV
jgi:hypothetical protein